ncbi:hypothetical protein AB1L08_21950 [Siminovitchia sp. 179-K 8D1 HS]
MGNKKALLELRRMIDIALNEEEAQGDFVSSDGEGYETFVIKVSDDKMKLFESIEMPYTEQYGEVNNHMYFVNNIKGLKEPYSPVVLLKNKDRS